MYSQARAIVWAQWRTLLNHYPRKGKGALAMTVLFAIVWYGIWAVAAAGLAVSIADPENNRLFATLFPAGLLLVFLYWQLIPLLMAATGASLDIRRLLVYPIPHSQLFSIEVVLRVATGVEMLLVLLGASVGLCLNPTKPFWAPLAFLPFVLMNLYIAAGIRDLLNRLLARKRVREILVILLVLVAALPQLVVSTGMQGKIKPLLERQPMIFWPWAAAGQLAEGRISWMALAIVLAWAFAAYEFGRWQFERSLRFDADAARASKLSPAAADRTGMFEGFFRWPSLLFHDPMGALVEKEVRFLTRAPRFRLLFLMGFSFGLLVWLPAVFSHTESGASTFSSNYLTFVSLYSLLLLGEACFWNTFGFDRSAAQVYFLAPLRLSTVIVAKNIASVFFILLELTAITAVCALLRMPLTPLKLAEAYTVTLVVSLYLMAVGNLTSTHNPRPVNPDSSFRTSSAGRVQVWLLLVYPLAAAPVALAFLARYAFEREIAFFAVLLVAGVIGLTVYWVALDSAVEATGRKTEQIIAALSHSEGPISS